MVCSACGVANDPGRKFCKECGARLALACTACGAANAPDDKFCGECGTPLYVQVSTRPDIVGVRVCTFDDPSGFRLEANIFVKSAQPWDHMDPAVPAFPTYPTGKSY